MTAFLPYSPPSLSPLAAIALNSMLTREAPWFFPVGGDTARLTPLAEAPLFSPVAEARVSVGGTHSGKNTDSAHTGDVWGLALSSLPLRLLPALAEAQEELLPAPLRQAVFEVLAAPLLAELGSFSGLAMKLAGTMLYGPDGTPVTEPLAPVAGPDGPVATFGFSLAFAANSAEPLLFRVTMPETQTARRFFEAVRTLAPRPLCGDAMARINGLPVPLTLEAGRMHLRLSELQTLAEGDVLFPNQYHAVTDTLVLRIGDAPGPVWTALCSVTNCLATLTGAPAACPVPEDTPMTDAPAPDAVPTEPYMAVDEVELTLSFDLERRTISVKELATLAPGYTFALSTDPASPVTLRVNSKAVGSGRLVDINGVLGVQITQLA